VGRQVVIAAWNAARSSAKAEKAKHPQPAQMGEWRSEVGWNLAATATSVWLTMHTGHLAVAVEEETPVVELSVAHTVGFIAMASAFLILLFYVNLNAVINVLYCISSGSAVTAVIMRPLSARMLGPRKSNAIICQIDRIGFDLTALDAVSTCLGFAVAVWWYLIRAKGTYAWVLQDLMGICLCILFLTLVRFPNVKTATVLLSLAFVYDIFFVFISPIFFHESVMVKVATGGQPTADPTYCEKYPSDKDCQTRDQLPMLLVLPRIGDYQGGFTMLGLGDIILPGLLVSFAARYDLSVGTPLTRGYFRLMVWGYAIGLMMANMAVYLMEMGQPALLYLVPCTLGVFAAVSYREGTLKDMWNGPPSLNDSRPAPSSGPVSPGGPARQLSPRAPYQASTTSLLPATGPTVEEEPLLDA
jgi:hypothetical protein